MHNAANDYDWVIEEDETAASARLFKRRHNRHREMLFISTTVCLLSFLLAVRPDQKVELFFLPGWAAPETCFTRTTFGTDCPGCGLTRSFIYLANGDLPASLAVNRIGWLFALATAIQIPYRSFLLFYWLKKRGLPEPVSPSVNTAVATTLIAVLIGNWLFNLCGL